MKSVVLALLFAIILMAEMALLHADAPAVLLAPVQVALGVAAACAAAGGWSWIAVVCGSASALALPWVWRLSPHLAVGLMTWLWLVPRLWFATNQRQVVVVLASSVGSAVVAGLIVTSFASDPWVQQGAASVFAGAALAVPLLIVPVSSPRAHDLLAVAEHLPVEQKSRIVEAVERARGQSLVDGEHAADGPDLRSLLRSADALVTLERSGAAHETIVSARKRLDDELLRCLEQPDQTAAVAPASTAEPSIAPDPATPPRAEPT